MEKITFDKDEYRYMIDFYGLQYSLYYEDFKEDKKMIKDTIMTITDFIKDRKELGTVVYNMYFLCYNGLGDTLLHLRLDEDNEIGFQLSGECIDYFKSITVKDLLNIVKFMREFIKKCSI